MGQSSQRTADAFRNSLVSGPARQRLRLQTAGCRSSQLPLLTVASHTAALTFPWQAPIFEAPARMAPHLVRPLMIPFSILDLAPIRQGGDASQAFRNSLD